MKEPLVAIIILNHNGKELTRTLIESIQKIDFPKEKIETILVDNASTDGSREFIKRNYPEIKLMQNKENLGFDEGNNVGVRAAKGKYIAMLSNDILVDKNWLKELITIIESDEKIGIVEPIIYDKKPEGKALEFRKKDFLERKYNSTSYIVRDGLGTTTIFHTLAFMDRMKNIPKNPLYIFSATSACLFRRQICEVPFDKDYFAYAEDTYFGWLARLKGHGVVHVPASILYHEGSATIKKLNRSRYFDYLSERNKMLNILTFYQPSTLVKLLPLMLIFSILSNLYGLKLIGAKLKAFFWIMANFGTVVKKRKNIQSQRKIPDKEIFRFMSCKFLDEENVPLAAKIPVKLLNSISFIYCFLFGIWTIEMQKSIPYLAKPQSNPPA